VGSRRTREDDKRERRALREAMQRLLDGRPEASSGELTKSDLAREAGLKRHHVANRHTDIGDEFMRRVAQMRQEPAQVTRLKDELAALRKDHLARGAELREKGALIKRYADNLAVAVLSVRRLERRVEVLERELANAPSSQEENVLRMSPRRR
jgi:hypothetical protein